MGRDASSADRPSGTQGGAEPSTQALDQFRERASRAAFSHSEFCPHRRHYLRATRPRLHSALWPSQFGFDLKDLTAEEEGKEEEEETTTTGTPKEGE